MAVSRLRPTPETGVVAATKQAASPLGPSWSQRAGRSARLAFRQAQRRNDSEGAMSLALKAEQAGLDPTATIGSAEERLAGQYQSRQADTAVVREIGGALTAGQMPVQGGPGKLDPRPPSAATQPPIPEAKPAPGASQPPENPVTGNATPETGDAPARLGARQAINPLTKKPFGFDPRNPAPTKATGSAEDFGSRVRELTSADGENLTRGDAVRKVNSERMAAGKPPLDYDETIDGMLAQDRQASDIRSKENSIRRGYDELGKELSAAREDPRIAARKAPPLPKPPPTTQTEAPALARQNPTTSPAYRFGQSVRGMTAPNVAARSLGLAGNLSRRAVEGARNTLAEGVAGVVSSASGLKDAAVEAASDKVVGGVRRKRRVSDLLRGLTTPPSR